MVLGIMALGIMALGIMALGIMALGIMALGKLSCNRPVQCGLLGVPNVCGVEQGPSLNKKIAEISMSNQCSISEIFMLICPFNMLCGRVVLSVKAVPQVSHITISIANLVYQFSILA